MSERFGPRECRSFFRGEDIGSAPHGDETELALGVEMVLDAEGADVDLRCADLDQPG